MKEINLKSLHIQNFKGCKDRMIELGDKTRISGSNATGKTTVFDAFTWLLFGKDSLGSASFDIRPLDSDGKMIDNIEISVEAVITVDGEEYSLRKVQKQIWRTKRGENTVKFNGNVNEFEINGYPKSEKEFKTFISGIIDEKVFNIVTNPNAFNDLPWKEQREILMKFASSFTDVEFAEKFGEEFAKLIPELKIANTDAILKKYKKNKNELDEKHDKIPTRIDEVSKQLVTVNVAELEIQKLAKEIALKKIEDELSGGNGKLEEINQKRQCVIELKFDLSRIQNKANEELKSQRKDAMIAVDNCEQKCRDIKKAISETEYIKQDAEREMQKYGKEKYLMAENWKEWKAKTFPEFVPLDPFAEPEPLKETDLRCPTCGQELPEEVKQQRIADHEKRCEKARADYDARCEAHKSKYEKEKSEFASLRDKTLIEITEKGQAAADNVRKFKKVSDDKQIELDSMNEKLKLANEELAKEESALKQIPVVADVSGNSEYIAIQKKIESLEIEITAMSQDTSGRAELEAKKAVIRDEIAEIEAEIKSADNSKVEARIAELEEEKKAVGQRIAEQEQMIDLTENFIRAKMKMISKAINEKFKVVSFILFNNQINGGLKETCECMVNGVPFSSLNSGHKIIAGLDIIRSLSELYEINCPVFVDNAESINEFNIPDMDCQMILLEVANEPELVVEVE